MTWLELYNILHSKANDIKNLDSDLWKQEVVCHNAETGQEDVLTNVNVDGKIVLAYNLDAFYGDE